jgi:hypothetical protein
MLSAQAVIDTADIIEVAIGVAAIIDVVLIIGAAAIIGLVQLLSVVAAGLNAVDEIASHDCQFETTMPVR